MGDNGRGGKIFNRRTRNENGKIWIILVSVLHMQMEKMGNNAPMIVQFVQYGKENWMKFVIKHTGFLMRNMI